jgi:hypothetical protein
MQNIKENENLDFRLVKNPPNDLPKKGYPNIHLKDFRNLRIASSTKRNDEERRNYSY